MSLQGVDFIAGYKAARMRIAEAGRRYQAKVAAPVVEAPKPNAAPVVKFPQPAPITLVEVECRRLFEDARIAMDEGDQLRKFPTIEMARRILEDVSIKHRVSIVDILSERRCVNYVLARQEAMYRLKNETTWSLTRIGRFLRRDHTTCLYGIEKHAQRIAEGKA
jgi:Bacterial dnaA protein helix-turn-helix